MDLGELKSFRVKVKAYLLEILNETNCNISLLSRAGREHDFHSFTLGSFEFQLQCGLC